MAAFNEIQKRNRAKINDKKRAIHGDPKTGKLRQRAQPVSISGKRKRKLLKKLKRDQKEAIEKGLITMDVDMEAADGTSEDNNQKAQRKFNVKKSSKLTIKKLKGKGKSKKKSKSTKTSSNAAVDAMVE